MTETLRPAVGTPVPRTEDRPLIQGKANWTDAIAPPATMHVAVLRSPFAHARITALDTTPAAELSGVVAVFSGADLADVKAARPEAGYLVEWDFPADLDMDTYLANKKAKAPKYAEVPEVSFLRTYVREDMEKCLCLYDAPDEGIVRKARDAVSTPIDRLHELDQG